MSKNSQKHELSAISFRNSVSPRASSTAYKQQTKKKEEPILKVPYPNSNSPNSSAESLDGQTRSSLSRLHHERALAASLLERTSKNYNLPSRYLQPESCASPTLPAGTESTVSESDLITTPRTTSMSFAPAEISTPRSSYTSPRSSISSRSSTSKNLAYVSQKLKNSDMSLAELFNQYLKLESESGVEESFVTGQLALERIAQQEQSWKREHDALGGNSVGSDSLFSQFENPSIEDKGSITHFFRKNSEFPDLCLKESPEKDVKPMPLVEESKECNEFSTQINEDNSVLSISEIEKFIAANDTTSRLLDYVHSKKKSPLKKNRKSIAHGNGKESKRESKENRLSCKLSPQDVQYRPSSIEPLKDYSSNIDKSSSTVYTASSLDSLPGGKLPIETNRFELVWGCIPVGKRRAQSFVLRNKSQNKLRLQLKTSSANFKIVNEPEADPVQILPILLYPAESRVVAVSFTPSALGAVAEKLTVAPISPELQQQQTKRQQLNLYGYGGYASIEIQSVMKDPNMKMWLPLGKLDNTCQLTQTFTLKNYGNLAGFACLSYSSKALYGYSKIVIYPTEVVLQPKELATITVTYTPTKDDVKHIFTMATSQVIDIGCIQIVAGEEPLRGRIRRLCNKLSLQGGTIENSLVERLSSKFKNEKMPGDLSRFSETVGCMKELLRSLISKEVILTLETDLEHPITEQIAGIDESTAFHSFAEGMMTVINADPDHADFCFVEPRVVILTPPVKMSDNIIMINRTGKILQYQISLSETEMLEVCPCEGILNPDETTLLKVSCTVRKPRLMKQQQQVCKLAIYVDDNVFDVDIKVIPINSSK